MANGNPNPVVSPPPTAQFVHLALGRRTAEVEQKACEAYAAILDSRFVSGLALVAVGGLGRGEMFPHSDVNLLLLVDPKTPSLPQEALAKFLLALREMGLRPSHSVRTVEDCVVQHSDNAELSISLLDRRMLAGDAALYQSLEDRFRVFTRDRGPAIARQLAGLAQQRRAKYQNTIYHLEPNVKDTPGGLRDLQTVRWLGMLQPLEGAPNVSAAFDFLAAVRLRLHELAGRDQNVLSFDAQEVLSTHPAGLMRDYYGDARRVDRAVRQAMETAMEKRNNLLSRLRQWRPHTSTSQFTVSGDRVSLRSGQMPRDLSLFEFVARQDLRLAPEAVERLREYAPEATWADWKRMLSLPRASLGLRAMQEAGVISKTLPEWQKIECLVMRDFFQRYTVDERAMVAIASLESVIFGPLVELFREVENLAAVRFALLLHEIGKGAGPTHADASLDIARGVLLRLGAPEEDRATIEFLISRRLDLSTAMSSRDPYDRSTARALAERVGTVERLKMLAMMTYGDISAMNPQAMTPWRMEQLWRLYGLVKDELNRELGTERVHNARGIPPERAQFLEGLPTRYLRLYSQEEITTHFELSQQIPSRRVALQILPKHGCYRLTLVTRDRPKLFASVAGAISSFGLNILKADAFSNAVGVVVDTFTFSDPHHTFELDPTEVDRLDRAVREVAEGKQDPGELLRLRPMPFRSARLQLQPSVSFKNDASEAATLVEIEAEDRPGLLYDLASTISRAGCNIEVVMLDTQAHKAMDVFYLKSQGQKLTGSLETRLKADLLAACSPSD